MFLNVTLTRSGLQKVAGTGGTGKQSYLREKLSLFYIFLYISEGNLRFILVVVRGSKIYFAALDTVSQWHYETGVLSSHTQRYYGIQTGPYVEWTAISMGKSLTLTCFHSYGVADRSRFTNNPLPSSFITLWNNYVHSKHLSHCTKVLTRIPLNAMVI